MPDLKNVMVMVCFGVRRYYVIMKVAVEFLNNLSILLKNSLSLTYLSISVHSGLFILIGLVEAFK